MRASQNRWCTHLDPHEPVIAGLRRHGDALIDHAVDLIRNPTTDRAEDIHLVRTSIKELRAIRRLIRPQLGEAVFRREDTYLRKTAQRLSATRDITAGQQALTRLLTGAASQSDRQALILVLDRYAKSTARQCHVSQEDELLAVGRALLATRSRLRKLRLAAEDCAVIGPGLQEVYHDCREHMKKAGAGERDRAFHRWRIRVKNLFYELRWLEAVWPKRLRKMVKSLKPLQDQLGCDHDLTVLDGILKNSPDKFGGVRAVECVLLRLEKSRQRLRRDSLKLGAAIFRENPKAFIHRFERHWMQWRGGGQ